MKEARFGHILLDMKREGINEHNLMLLMETLEEANLEDVDRLYKTEYFLTGCDRWMQRLDIIIATPVIVAKKSDGMFRNYRSRYANGEIPSPAMIQAVEAIEEKYEKQIALTRANYIQQCIPAKKPKPINQNPISEHKEGAKPMLYFMKRIEEQQKENAPRE